MYKDDILNVADGFGWADDFGKWHFHDEDDLVAFAYEIMRLFNNHLDKDETT
jgi:hypothetical protein